jgi:hypothetical protein
MKSFTKCDFALVMGLCLALLAGCSKVPDADDNPGTKPASPSDLGTGLNLDAATQARLGLEIVKPAASQWESEVTAYGVVMDPAQLAGAFADLSASAVAADASDKEYARQQTLAAQNNSSARALEAAQSAALHDDLARTSGLAKFKAEWGSVLAGRAKEILPMIADNQASLVRMNLTAGENLASPPLSARIILSTSETNAVSADFLDALPGVDPESQGQSFLFLVNKQALPPNAAVTGFLKVPGEPLNGVMVPAAAVLRYEGKGWVYLQTGTNQFVRQEIPLEYPMTGGWFVPDGLPLTNGVVVTGAQAVLSAELSGGGFNTGERD